MTVNTMEKLYTLEHLPEGVDPVAVIETMTRNIRLMWKNVDILSGEVVRLRAENERLLEALSTAMSHIEKNQATEFFRSSRHDA